MKLNVNELIKLLVKKEGITQKELAAILTEKTGKKVTPDGLSRKLTTGTLTFNFTSEIVDILGYEMSVFKKEISKKDKII